jgi:transcriptional regulator with XRE-family HTH domain
MRMHLKLAILAAGKTQRQVAAETKLLSENRLSEIVRGWVQPSDAEKKALAQSLNRPVSVLFGDSASSSAEPTSPGTTA